MEEAEIRREYNDEEGETILDHREYIINHENKNYNLRLEIIEKKINIIISLNDIIEYNYKAKMSLATIVDNLGLNSKKFNDLELILKLFDKIYEKKKIFININNVNGNDDSCNLIIKLVNADEENTYEIKIYKNYMKTNDKFNLLFNQIKELKENNNNNFDNSNKKIEQMDNKIKELNTKIEQKDKEMKEIINNKDNIINEMKQKMINQENRIKELENKTFDLINKNENNINNSIKKHENETKIMNNKITNLENIIKNMKQEMNKLNNKIKEQENKESNNNKIIENKFSNINAIINNKINDSIKLIENKINEKMKDEEINNIKNVIHDLEYKNKINYEFISCPKNLKYKLDITSTNTSFGWNDIFEIFISYKDNKEYLVSPNSNNFNLDIFSLINNQKIESLKGHNNHIRTIRYFINNKNKNEYLISGDDDKTVIIWDITDNFNIKYKIETNYGHDIYSCLLIFPHNSNNNFIITSSFNDSGKDDDSATKIYSLNNGEFIKYINNTNNNAIYYLLSWYNKINNKYYIIQFSFMKIIINNLLEDELYSELSHEPEESHFGGFIYYKDNNDYLCSSSYNGYINIWDLYNKNIFKVINTNGCKLAHIIEWNKKYIIVADYNNKSFKIIDMENDSISNINPEHKGELKCVKKINHPIYGESLLSAGDDKTIKIWMIE